MVLYFCDRCGYSTNHKNRFREHLNRKNICAPTLYDSHINEVLHKYGLTPDESQNTKMLPNHTKMLEDYVNKKTPNHICLYCYKNLSRLDSLKRHHKICKMKEKKEKDIIEENIELKKTLMEYKNQPNITNNTINNINNIVINNYGNENLSYVKESELTKYVKNLPPGLLKFIEKVHFNPKHPENNNLRITNRKDNFIQIRKKNKWLLEDKNEIINNLLIDKYQYLEQHLSQINSNELTHQDHRLIERFRQNYDVNVQYVKNLLKRVELLILNNSH